MMRRKTVTWFALNCDSWCDVTHCLWHPVGMFCDQSHVRRACAKHLKRATGGMDLATLQVYRRGRFRGHWAMRRLVRCLAQQLQPRSTLTSELRPGRMTRS